MAWRAMLFPALERIEISVLYDLNNGPGLMNGVPGMILMLAAFEGELWFQWRRHLGIV